MKKEVIFQKTGKTLTEPPHILFSAQGGIGTHEEDAFLHQHYDIDSTGWGTPFLLVPEATTVDTNTLKLLCAATEKDIVLSNNSPLGVRFHYLKGATGELEKTKRIQEGKSGSPCTEKHLALNTEFTQEPICTASQKYQKLKIEHLQTLNLSETAYQQQVNEVLDKECLCVGLSNAAAITYGEKFVKKQHGVTICPSPNIANFSQVVSLQTMTDHIYGRKNVMTAPNRQHMFITELHLYINYLKEQLEKEVAPEQVAKKKKYCTSFYQNMKEGITYYKQLTAMDSQFYNQLNDAELEVDKLFSPMLVS